MVVGGGLCREDLLNPQAHMGMYGALIFAGLTESGGRLIHPPVKRSGGLAIKAALKPARVNLESLAHVCK